MWSVFDLQCDGRHDPCTSDSSPVLSWRMGSDRQNAEQMSCRIVVTSMLDGACRWDSGRMRTRSNAHRYRGSALELGETCVWFVSSWDDSGARADGAPASFTYSSVEQAASNALVEERVGFVWTSDEVINDGLDEGLASVSVNDAAWRDAAGLTGDEGMRRIRIRERDVAGPFRGLGFVQVSLKSAYGLLLARWDRGDSTALLRLSLPPGTVAEIDAFGTRCTLRSGRHELRSEA